MSKKTVIVLWAVVIISYIINIILISVGITSLFNNIMAWVVAIMLALDIIYLQCTLINKQKHINNINKILEYIERHERGER